MSTRDSNVTVIRAWLAIAVFGLPVLGLAQVPVDDSGEPYSEYTTERSPAGVGDEGIPLLTPVELEELVGPIALYPDDLLAIVLPASTYPLQVVQAGRFLEELENDASLQPDEAWDDSVVALLNYPEVVELLNEDLDWTWRLGEAVVAQQPDVIAAVETFRDRAYAAGNLKSDAHQTVSHSDEGIIEIVPMDDEIIYVPYYEPERVVVYQPRPVYHYYPRPYPVYYYPYPSTYYFDRGFFWGVTTAFTIGWYTDRLHVFHHSYRGHPYYGRHYYDRWWYRRPSINIYNNYYVHRNLHRARDYRRSGDYWHSREHRRLRSYDRRITRNRFYPGDSGYVTRQTTAKTSYSTTRDRDYRHKRFSAGDDSRASKRRLGTAQTERRQGFATDRDTVVRHSTRDSKRRDAGKTNRSRDRARTDASRSHKSAPTVRRGYADVTRESSQANRTRMLESRETRKQTVKRSYRPERIEARKATVDRSPRRDVQRIEPRRREIAQAQRHDSRRSEPSRRPQMAKAASRPERTRAAAPKSDARKISRSSKAQRSAEPSTKRPERRAESRRKERWR